MSNPNESPQGFDFYRYRTAMVLGGAATAIVGEICFGGSVERMGDVVLYLGGCASGAGLLCHYLQKGQNPNRHDS